MAYGETHSGSATVNKDGSVSLTRTFRLFTGNAASRPAWAVAGIGINKYDPHPDDARCLATDVSSTPVAGELGYFDLSYTYTNRLFDAGTSTPSGDPGQLDPTQIANPVDRPPVIKWGSNSRTVPFTRDWSTPNRKPVQNSAGQPFEGLEVEDYTGVITVSFNRFGIVNIPSKQAAYLNRVNDANFQVRPIFAAYATGTLRCNSWSGTYQYEADYGWYTACEVELEYRADEWKKEILDAGWYQKKRDPISGGYREEKFVDPTTGIPVDAPVKLDGTGKKLADGAADVYLTFITHKRVSFTNLFA